MDQVEVIRALFNKTFGEIPAGVVKLPASGSERSYFRITGSRGDVIGVFHTVREENEAFLSFTRTFSAGGIPVPEILAENLDQNCYLLSDLGNQTLFSYLAGTREGEPWFTDQAEEIYKQVVRMLPKFQLVAGKEIDYSKCYPRDTFDKQSMLWDLNYFKYYFLKLAHVPFDEQALENDFQVFTEFLLQADAGYFMYRDFQSRNIMLVENTPYFIDYQGGRKGPLQYDVASLLYDAKAALPQTARDRLLHCYLDELDKYIPGKRSGFISFFPGFILIRILQALGAYGYRGYYERKIHFLQSIPYAMSNLKYLRSLWLAGSFGVELPALFSLIDQMVANPFYSVQDKVPQSELMLSLRPEPSRHPASEIRPLTVTITSFSYKIGIPADPTEHGGGYVFDCRALPNPGRFDTFKQLTGLDQPVIGFLNQEPDVGVFLHNATSMVGQSVSKYLERGFQHLSVNFGCTGGQHRSVYCAEKLKEHLVERYPVTVIVDHTNL